MNQFNKTNQIKHKPAKEPRKYSFSDILTILKFMPKNKFTKASWGAELNGVRTINWISVQYPDINSKMSQPYLFKCVEVRKKNDYSINYAPYTPSNEDLFAEDWIEFTE